MLEKIFQLKENKTNVRTEVIAGIFTMITVLFTFLFVDMFDTTGTLIGVSTKANMLNEEGRIRNVVLCGS